MYSFLRILGFWGLIIAFSPYASAKSLARTVRLPAQAVKRQQGPTCWLNASVTALEYLFYNRHKKSEPLLVNPLVRADWQEKRALYAEAKIAKYLDRTGFPDRALELVERIGLVPSSAMGKPTTKIENGKVDEFVYDDKIFTPREFLAAYFDRPIVHEYTTQRKIPLRAQYGPFVERWKEVTGFWREYRKTIVRGFRDVADKVILEIDIGRPLILGTGSGASGHEVVIMGYSTDGDGDLTSVFIQDSTRAPYFSISRKSLERTFVHLETFEI